MSRWSLLVCYVALLGLTSCNTTKKVVKETKQPVKTAQDIANEKQEVLKKKLGIPKKLDTLIVNKGQLLKAYLHPGGYLRAEAPQNKKNDWDKDYLRKKKQVTWYARLSPRDGANLGSYLSNFVVMATYNGPGGFPRSAIVLLQAGLLRDGKELMFFQSLQKPRGQNYARYDQPNRELDEKATILKKGDILFFRVKHRKGPSGAVAYGGGLGSASSHVVFSHLELGPSYFQYTK